MLTDQQYERLFSMKHKKQYFYQVADAAGVSAKTARKHLSYAAYLLHLCRTEAQLRRYNTINRF